MKDKKNLKKLAKLIYEMTQKEVWLGGKGNKGWPQSISSIDSEENRRFKDSVAWTLSPEVELGGHRLRVCISSPAEDRWGGTTNKHNIRVFVDGILQYPGGLLGDNPDKRWWRKTWSGRIAIQERTDGGKTGPVDRGADLIVEAREKLRGVPTLHPPQLSVVEEPNEAMLKALREIDALGKKL